MAEDRSASKPDKASKAAPQKAKRPRKRPTPPAEQGTTTGSQNVAKWWLSVVGVVLLIVGFILLSRANERADNLPALTAPFMILGGYLMIFVAIVLGPTPSDAEPSRKGKREGR